MFLKAVASTIAIFYSFSLPAQNILSFTDIKLFTDSFFISQQDRFGALGICIVKDTNVLYEAAYGVTDFDKPHRNTVSPTMTTFGAASVSKLFTATAVMQLVDQGKLHLDDDIRKYLPWLEIRFAENYKITIRQLLTHTAGIEDGMVGVNYNDARLPVTMENFFKEQKPKVIFTPGKQMSYSNRGMALAGLIVETVSGIPFYEYVEKNIFGPLKMQHSSFRQPLPDTLKEKSLAYLPELDNDFLIIYPSGSLFTTIADMGNFMLAHLNNGMFQGSEILKASTVQLMQSPQFTPGKGIPFMNAGFMEMNYYGYKILYQTGARYYNTILILIPELKIGIYIALNGDGSVRKEYLQQFLKKYLTQKKLFTKQYGSIIPEHFRGIYRLNVGSRTTFEMLPLMVMQAKIGVQGNQLIFNALGFKPVALLSVNTNVFIGEDGGYYVFELRNNKGFRLFRSNVPWDDPMTFTRISFYENGILHGVLLLSSALILIVMFLIWSLKIMFGKFYFKNSNYFIRLISILSYTSVSFFILPILLVIGFTLTRDYATQVKSNLYLLFTLFNVSVALGIIVLSLFLYLLKLKIGSKSFKIQLSIVSFAFLILLCIGWYWNLIGYHFK